MCGIAGIVNLGERSAPARPALTAMIATLAHRGPDGFGYFTDRHCGLAHARLSIIDLSTGDQPIANEDGSIQVVFNGEIFNYLELRAQLVSLGYVFRTQSDTETIVHAYEAFGDAFVEQLNGQFAIALWDVKRRRLLLVRDRVGIRPLFVQRDGSRMLFASEVKAILAVSSQPRRLDLRGLSQMFTFWATVGETSVFEGVRSIPPGSMLIIEHGVGTLTNYWQWSYPPAGDHSHQSFEEAAAELRSLLSDSIRLQLRSDVPVGAYLSGGLDSAIIASMIREHSDVPIRTFSVAFDDAEFDESSFQQVMVRHLGTEHTTLHCTQADIGNAFAKLIEHTESPVLRTGPVPLMLLSDHVRQAGFKVVLTGEGADEVFGGYDIFKEAQIRRFWARRPDSTCRPQLLSRLYPYLRHSPVGSQAFSASFFGQGLKNVDSPFYAHTQRWATTRRLHSFLSPEATAGVASYRPEDALRKLLPDGFDRWAGLSKDQFVEAQTLMSGYLLSSQGDRVAMANSVEGRVPFLDHRVIEFANKLPPRYRLRGLREKAVLRRAVADLLPSVIVNRTKQPYRAPDSRSFFSGGQGGLLVEDLLSAERLRAVGYFDARAVGRLVDKCRAGRAIGFADNMAFVGILSTMLVHDRFIEGANVSAPESALT